MAVGLVVACGWLAVRLVFTHATPSPVRFDEGLIATGYVYAYGATAADFDADGRLDVAATDSWFKTPGPWGAKLWMYWGGGPAQQLDQGQRFRFLRASAPGLFLLERVVAVDLNGDGRLDIAGVVNSHAAVVGYLNPGSRGARWRLVVLTGKMPGAVNLAVADVDGDGDPDLFVSSRRGSIGVARPGIAWLENRPGRWVLRPIDLGPTNGDVRTVVPQDIDGDRRIDVLTSDETTGALAWYRGGDWRKHVIVGVSTRHAHFAGAGDIDGDGVADIVTGIDGGLAWLKRAAGGQWRVTRVARFASPPWRASIVTEAAVADVDRDGRNDIVFTRAIGRTGGGVYWARNPGPGTDWRVHVVREDWGRAVGVSTPDLNGDGRPDILAVGEYGAQQVIAWINRG